MSHSCSWQWLTPATLPHCPRVVKLSGVTSRGQCYLSLKRAISSHSASGQWCTEIGFSIQTHYCSGLSETSILICHPTTCADMKYPDSNMCSADVQAVHAHMNRTFKYCKKHFIYTSKYSSKYLVIGQKLERLLYLYTIDKIQNIKKIQPILQLWFNWLTKSTSTHFVRQQTVYTARKKHWYLTEN